ncbi:MAG: glycosyltransferase [Candidatus Nanopelagicales bacterium]
MDQPAVVAVIVTYDRASLLRECLDAVEDQVVGPDLIVVVDNASTDSTAADLAARSWRVPSRVVRMSRNLGGAMGFAVGLREAVDAGAQQVWLMDDDAIPDPDALQWLLADLEAAAGVGRTPAFTCSAVTWHDGSAARMNIPRASATWNETALLTGREVTDVETASFVSVLIPAAHATAVGLPHGSYFKWYDDTEYTLRLSRRFGAGLYSARSVVRHLTAHNRGAAPWEATDADVDLHARALRNRVSASLSVRDARGLLSATRDTAKVVVAPGLPVSRRVRLLGGYARGFGYRPAVRPASGRSWGARSRLRR